MAYCACPALNTGGSINLSGVCGGAPFLLFMGLLEGFIRSQFRLCFKNSHGVNLTGVSKRNLKHRRAWENLNNVVIGREEKFSEAPALSTLFFRGYIADCSKTGQIDEQIGDGLRHFDML
ncbi:hypothetical protein B566_EDAN010390, partial [Ephemera danica]